MTKTIWGWRNLHFFCTFKLSRYAKFNCVNPQANLSAGIPRWNNSVNSSIMQRRKCHFPWVKLEPDIFSGGFIVGTTVTKTTGLFPFFLRVATTNDTEPNSTLYIHLVDNGDEKAGRSGARLADLLGRQSGAGPICKNVDIWVSFPSHQILTLRYCGFCWPIS